MSDERQPPTTGMTLAQAHHLILQAHALGLEARMQPCPQPQGGYAVHVRVDAMGGVTIWELPAEGVDLAERVARYREMARVIDAHAATRAAEAGRANWWATERERLEQGRLARIEAAKAHSAGGTIDAALGRLPGLRAFAPKPDKEGAP